MRPMAEQTGTVSIPIRGGRIEAFRLPAADGATGVPLLVLGGVETGLRPLAGTEQVAPAPMGGAVPHVARWW